MKATIEFNLPEDEYDFEAAAKAMQLSLALYDLLHSRSSHKHEPSAQEYDFWDRVTDEVQKQLSNRGILELVERMP